MTDHSGDQDKSFIQKLFVTKRVKYLGLIDKIEQTLTKFRKWGIGKSVRSLSGFETRVSASDNQNLRC